MAASPPALRRVIGVTGATSIGLAAMIGAGVFTVWGPATASSGALLLGSLALAAVVAIANALSSLQLAVRYPEAGGAYVYGRRVLGEWWGFLAGWSFVVGKTASCAAMAMAVAAALVPLPWQRPVGIVVALALGLLASAGVTRTVRASLVAVSVVVGVLVVLLVLSALVPSAPAEAGSSQGLTDGGPLGVLQAAGLLFFAFAGYARMATLGEEVRDPRRTLVRAMPLALAIVLVLYAILGATLLRVLGPARLAESTSPVLDLAHAAGGAPLAVAVSVAAVIAAAGALLALLAGIGRTALAMARERDLPAVLDRVSARSGAPAAAQLTVAVAVATLVALGDLRTVIGFSSFGVLLYYFVANLAAWRQPRGERLVPRVAAAVGMVGTLGLAATLPIVSVVGGAVVVAAGVRFRLVRLRVRGRES